MSRSTGKAKAAQLMKETLLQWLCIKHATDQFVTREMLKNKALELVKYYNVEGYKCGESWITHFLKRYKFSTTLTECCGPEFEDFATWVEIIRPYLSTYPYEDQFFLDDLAMYTDFKPCDQRHPTRDSNATSSLVNFDDGGLNSKDQQVPAMNIVSILLAVNASGTEKMPPIISGRYKIESPCQDCVYQSDKYSIINEGVLAGWLRSMNNKMAKSNRTIALVLNRSHVNAVKFAELTHIHPIYLPNKFPSYLLPLRRDVYHFIKMYYRSSYVHGLCQQPTKDFWEPEEIINCLVDAWKNVTAELIVVNFQRTKFRNDDVYLNIKCPLWQTLKIAVTFEKFVTFDDFLCEPRDANFNLGLLEPIRNVDTDLRSSFSHDGSVSKSNFVEDSISSQDLDGSLKRPSDDSVDEYSCEPMDYSKVHRNFPVNNEDIPMQNVNPPAIKIDDNAEETAEVTGWKSAGSDKPIINLATDRSVSSDQIDEVNSTSVSVKNSPTNTSSPTVNKRYHENLINRMNPSPEPTCMCSSNFTPDNCIHQLSSNTLINLDQKYERFDSDPGKSRQMICPRSPIPSTSKQGLEESYALQRLYSDSFYNEKIHQITPTVIKSPQVDVFIDRDNGAGAGDGDGDDINFKRPHPNEDTCIHPPAANVTAIDNYGYIEEPPNKKIKFESNWAECYQGQFVFGHNRSNSFDHPANLQAVAIEPTVATENMEVEKRSIFTITDNTQGQFGINEK